MERTFFHITNQLQSGEVAITESNAMHLIKELLPLIGAEDQDVREKIVLPTIQQIIENQLIDEFEKASILKKLVSDYYLFYGIGDKTSANLIKRANAALLIGWIIRSDVSEQLLSAPLKEDVLNELLLYLDIEYDLRTDFGELGQVYSLKNTFVAIEQLLQSKETCAFVEIIFQTIVNKICTYHAIYTNDEEEYAAGLVEVLIEKTKNDHFLEIFLDKLPNFIHKQRMKLSEEDYFVLYKNSKAFLKSLFVLMYQQQNSGDLVYKINDTITKI